MPEQWYQQQLTPTEVYECNLRLGLIPAADHSQALVELKDPVTGILIAQWSEHHRPLGQWVDLLGAAHRKALDMVGTSIEPF